MKKLILLAVLAATTIGARADGLKQNLVPADARWLLHLDGAAFRKSRIGAMIVEDKCEPKVRQARKDTQIDFDFSFNKITAITAFGPKVGEQDNAVLVIQTVADVRGDLEKLIALKEKNGGNEPPVARITVDGNEIYTVGGDVNATEAAKGIWVVSKSRSSMLAASAVAAGKAPAIKDAPFLEYPAITNSFFLLAAADTGGADKLPAQAQILKKADGGRVVLGESGDKLFLNLALKSKDSDAVAQIQQVLQGLIAIVSLSQPDNKDLIALAGSAAVSSTSQIVSLNLSFPLERAMKKVRDGE